MWKLVPTDLFERRKKAYQKKQPAALIAVLENLADYVAALGEGTKPLQIKAGFIHSEGLGVLAIDQKGAVRKLAQTRLYIYPDAVSECLYLITLGDKSSQKEDIKTSHVFVNGLPKGDKSDHEQ